MIAKCSMAAPLVDVVASIRISKGDVIIVIERDEEVDEDLFKVTTITFITWSGHLARKVFIGATPEQAFKVLL